MAGKSFKDNPALKFISRTAASAGGPETDVARETERTDPERGPIPDPGGQGSRINLSFTPDDFQYLQTIARQDGLSMTEYLNRLISADRRTRIDDIKNGRSS